MKKYVFPHPVLLVEGQIFSLLLCFILLIFGYQTIFNFESIGIVGIIGIIGRSLILTVYLATSLSAFAVISTVATVSNAVILAFDTAHFSLDKIPPGGI